MTNSSRRTYSRQDHVRQRVHLRALAEQWADDARIAGECVDLCANDADKEKLARRQIHFQTCADELLHVVETGRLPPRMEHGR